jgi:MarR family transcriptional regulator, lower aerobic nicotinate degradation pathway regulator
MTTTDPQTPLKQPSQRPPKALVASPAHLLKHLGFRVKDRYVEAFESTGVAPSHYGVLVLLEEEPRETQAQIADALGYDRSHLVGILDELEERGLIERRRDPDDRRRHLVSLTPDGKRALREFRVLVDRIDDEFFAPLDDDQRRTLHELLLALAGYHEPRYKP